MTDCARSSFGRYYTKPEVGQILVELMLSRQPQGLIDLGVGGGSLALAAARRWSNLNLLTIDVDANSGKRLSKLFANEEIRRHRHLRTDALEPGLARLVQAEFGEFDAAVCNPPFTTPVWRKGFDEILEESGFSGCMPVLADADSALLFLAQALRLIGRGSTLGIIVPDTLVSGFKYRRFRHELLSRYQVEVVVRLPRNSFLHTEALAHILIIRKGFGSSGSIPLRKIVEGKLSPTVKLVDVAQATTRLDFDYHAGTQVASPTNRGGAVCLLGDLAIEVQRGSVQATAARQAGLPVFHTTEMTEQLSGRWIDLGAHSRLSGDRKVWAETGDILMARVGRNLERKVLGARSGMAVLTDCVYRISVPPVIAKRVLAQLSSDYGRTWLASRSYGVGAKQLSMVDLLTFPISM
jgi:type I restriction enzyme M protein